MGKADLTLELQEAIRRKDWSGAVQSTEKLIKLDPQNAPYRLRLGEFYVKAGNPAKGVASYQKAAETFGGAGFIVKALAAYKIILRLDPANEKAREGVSGLHAEAKEQALEFSMSLPKISPISPGEPGSGSEKSDAPIMDAWEISKQHLMKDIEKSAPVSDAPGLPPEKTLSASDFSAPETPSASPGSVSPSPVAKDKDDRDEEEMDAALIGSTPVDLDSDGKSGGTKGILQSGKADERGGASSPKPLPVSKTVGANAVTLFSSLTKEEFSELTDRMNPYLFEPGAKIVSEGDRGNSVFVISSGTVQVITKIGSKEVVLAELKDNDFFGEVSFLTGRPRTADIIAKTSTEILELPGDDLKAVIEKFPRVQKVLEEFHRSRALDTLEKIMPTGEKGPGDAD